MRRSHELGETVRRRVVSSWPSGGAAMLLSVGLVVPGGVIGEHHAPASGPTALSRSAATNTIVVTGKYSGTLKLEDPAKNCNELIDDPNGDIVRLYFSGKLSGLNSNKWTFIAVEKHSGTFTQSHILANKAALLYSYTTGFGFAATSGKITIGGKTGSFSYKVSWYTAPGSIGGPNVGSGTAKGSWSCPSVVKV